MNAQREKFLREQLRPFTKRSNVLGYSAALLDGAIFVAAVYLACTSASVWLQGLFSVIAGTMISTLFVLAHAAYGAPAMFVTVAFLSLAYGWLARRRGSVWAAAAAHALFDAVQLLVVLPAALREMEGQP